MENKIATQEAEMLYNKGKITLARADGLCNICKGAGYVYVPHYQVPEGVRYECSTCEGTGKRSAFSIKIDGQFFAIYSYLSELTNETKIESKEAIFLR